MGFISTLLDQLLYTNPPTFLGWLVLLILAGLLVFGLYRWRTYQPAWKSKFWLLLLLFAILTPLSALFLGMRFPSGSSLPTPGVPAEPPAPVFMFFSAIPWTLAGGLLGPFPAAILGFVSGLIRGFWSTHNLFTGLQTSLLALLFSALVRQRYRTLTFRLMRQPIVAVMCLLPVYVILYVTGILFTDIGQSNVTAQLDYALSNVGNAALAAGLELLLAGLVAQFSALLSPSAWGHEQPLQPSPAERSLQTRFLLGTGTFISLLLLTLLIGDWVVAGNAARRMLRDRLASTAEMAAQSVPFFLETGQNLSAQIAADSRLRSAQDPELSSILAQRMQAVPYFNEIFLLNVNGNILGAYPLSARQNFRLEQEEKLGLYLASSGVLAQTYSIPPANPNDSARVTFLTAIVESSGEINLILLCRTDLKTNPLTQPLLQSLSNMSDLDGTGILLDENGRILYHPNSALIMSNYTGQRYTEPTFYDNAAPDGTRELAYYQPVNGRPWAIALTVPARQVQQLALNIAAPLSLMILILALVAMISLRIGLGVITGSLQNLANEAMRISQGQLDYPIQGLGGVDEVGQLRRAFEQMRIGLKDRMEELNRLLLVSMGTASTLQIENSVKPVLEAVLATGASSARVVLSPDVVPEGQSETPSRFAQGQQANAYAHLDDQIMSQAERQEILILTNLGRARGLNLDPSLPRPGALMAVALRHENRFLGVLWAGYEQPRLFSDADARFMTTLANQMALAASNAYLFMSVEVGRQQLEAILASTPDPVLVTDHRNRLVLANPAAQQIFGAPVVSGAGRSIQRLIDQKPLLELLQASSSNKQSAEVVMPGGQTYLATASTVMAEGRPVGRVCILRDVTHFKELDTLKSEFVATVSHDLRSPLTLMRGYATMLEMVGELNEQQQGYVRKIIAGVENMSRLVNNLLDLGRIDLGVGLQVETFPLLDILNRVVDPLQAQASQKEITLTSEAAPDLPILIEADQALLYQAVYNLVENAIKYTPPGGKVQVRLSGTKDNVLFAVQDNGIGIDPEDIPRLFEKFYRGRQREARAQHGTGLGLAIVRSIAERHGGRVWIESQLGKGSTFYLQIPVRQS